MTPYSTGALDRALTGVLVSAIRQAAFDFNRNDSASRCRPRISWSRLLSRFCRSAQRRRALAARRSRAVRAALQQRIGEWWQRARKMTGGARLGYKTDATG